MVDSEKKEAEIQARRMKSLLYTVENQEIPYPDDLFQLSFMDVDGLENRHQYMEKAAAAGHRQATRCLGDRHRYGVHHYNKDLKKAVEYYKKASAMGCLESRKELAILYIHHGDVEEEASVGIAMLTDMAENNGDRYSQYYLGIEYMNGETVSQDFEEAYFWLYKASQQDHNPADRYLGDLENEHPDLPIGEIKLRASK